MAQRFRVEPAWGLREASAGTGTRSEDAAAGQPLPGPVLPAIEGEVAGPAPGEGASAIDASAGTNLAGSTERWEGAAAPVTGAGTRVSTERWEGAAAITAAVPGAEAERLARTEPWDAARVGARSPGPRAASPWTRWGLVVLGVLALGVAMALIAAVMLGLAPA